MNRNRGAISSNSKDKFFNSNPKDINSGEELNTIAANLKTLDQKIFDDSGKPSSNVQFENMRPVNDNPENNNINGEININRQMIYNNKVSSNYSSEKNKNDNINNDNNIKIKKININQGS